MEYVRDAPSQPAALPKDPQVLDYPFQQICAYYMEIHNMHYLVIVDRYSNWPMVYKSNRVDELITFLRYYFTLFQICEVFSSDGGPQFVALELKEFFKTWGEKNIVSSAYCSYGNT